MQSFLYMAKKWNQHELTQFLVSRLRLLFQLLPCQPWWLQQPRACMAIQNAQQPENLSNKQLT